MTTSFASAYLMAMAAGNLAGRLGWAAVSDKIGKSNYLKGNERSHKDPIAKFFLAHSFINRF